MPTTSKGVRFLVVGLLVMIISVTGALISAI